MADINVKNVDREQKRKTLFVLNCKGSDLSKEVKKMLEKYAEEYDKMNKGE